MSPLSRRSTIAGLAATTLLLAACGGDDSSDGGQASGVTDVTVTTLNLCDELYVYYGVEEGIFAEHDLDVETVQSTGGSAALAALQSGDVDVAFANPFSVMLAEEQGIDLTIVSGAYNSPAAPEPAATVVAVGVDSGISEPADLEGRTMAVNELGGINQIMTEAWLREGGADPAEVEFVALPFPELAPALVNGTVDAANLTGSAMAANADAVVEIGNPMDATEAGYTVFATYAANTSWLDENPEAASRWAAAFADIDERFQDPAAYDAAIALAAERCGTPVERLRTLPMNAVSPTVDVAVLEEMAELGVESGVLGEVPDIEDLVAPDARN